MHEYFWCSISKVHICQYCGCAKHAENEYWFAGIKYSIEPNCMYQEAVNNG
ncbi:MAG: hypothetical protein ACRCXK_11290 [Wohlfahrtiimonas sp.]